MVLEHAFHYVVDFALYIASGLVSCLLSCLVTKTYFLFLRAVANMKPLELHVK